MKNYPVKISPGILVLFTLLILMHPCISIAQIDFNNYMALKCSGKIPEEFLTNSVERSKQIIEQEETISKKSITDEDEKRFILTSTFLTSELFRSGKILFGDTVTLYVNQVADRVLENDPELHKKIHFYCIRSSEANAFSTLTGDVFVTLGLLAQLENEAQLAFILSHEIGHFEMNHSLREYEQNKSADEDYSDENDDAEIDTRIRNASNLSKSLEMEADSVGLIRMQNSGYDCQESIGALFVLQFSELPFDEISFDSGFLESGEMKFPKNLVLDSIKPIDLDGDLENDDYSTHPNIAKRNHHLESLIGDQICPAKKFFGMESEFLCARKICRFETIRIQLSENDYIPAFYNSYILLKTDSTSLYLHTCMAKSLYSLSMYKNHDEYKSVTKSYTKVEGMQQQCYYFFSELTPSQLNMIALRYTYNMLLSDTTSVPLKKMCDDLTVEAISSNHIHMDNLRSSTAAFEKLQNPDSVSVAVNPAVSKDTVASLSKYDKLRTQKRLKEQSELTDMVNSNASKFHLLAFSDLLSSPEFLRLFESGEKRAVNYSADVISGRATTSLKDEGLSPQDTRLGIDSVVFVGPYYFTTNDKVGFDASASITGLDLFTNQITTSATAKKVNYQTIFPDKFTIDDVEKYNDLSALIEWQDECTSQSTVALLPCGTDLVEPLEIKYKTTHFMFLAINSLKEKKSTKKFQAVVIVTTVVVVLFALAAPEVFIGLVPLGLAAITISGVSTFVPKYNLTYRALLLDSGSGTILLNENDRYKKSPSVAHLSVWLNTTFSQIKNKPVKHKVSGTNQTAG